MSFEYSLWDDAGEAAEFQESHRRLVTAKVKAAPVWPFLAQARTQEEYGHRRALAEDRLIAAAQESGVDYLTLVSALDADFTVLDHARRDQAAKGAQKATTRRLAIVRVSSEEDPEEEKGEGTDSPFGDEEDSDSGDSDSDSSDSGKDPEDEYYVVDEDSGKDVGGPYDDQGDAQKAIDGGDFDGGDLKAEKGPEGGSGDDADGDDADADDGGGEGSSSDSEDAEPGGGDQGDSKEEGEESDNPFAKGGSNSNKVVYSATHNQRLTTSKSDSVSHEIWSLIAKAVEAGGDNPFSQSGGDDKIQGPNAGGGTPDFASPGADFQDFGESTKPRQMPAAAPPENMGTTTDSGGIVPGVSGPQGGQAQMPDFTSPGAQMPGFGEPPVPQSGVPQAPGSTISKRKQAGGIPGEEHGPEGDPHPKWSLGQAPEAEGTDVDSDTRHQMPGYTPSSAPAQPPAQVVQQGVQQAQGARIPRVA